VSTVYVIVNKIIEHNYIYGIEYVDIIIIVVVFICK